MTIKQQFTCPSPPAWHALSMDNEAPPLTRDDFDDREAWLRHCHEGGVDLAHDGDRFPGIDGATPHAALLGGILGQTRRIHERAWGSRGWTSNIAVAQFEKAYRAVAFTNCLGAVMNTTMDISWSTAGVKSDVVVAARQRDYLDALRRWFERNGARAAWLWVMEQGHRYGLHTHLLMHVPDDLYPAFRQYARQTLERMHTGHIVWTRASKTMLIQHRYGPAIDAQWRRFRYMMKAITQERGWQAINDPSHIIPFAERTGLTPRNEGVVRVKRLGVSRFLDSASLNRWSAVNGFPDMRVRAVGDTLYDDRFLRWYRDAPPPRTPM